MIVGPWLPRLDTFQLIRRPASLLDSTKVSSLITTDHEWDEGLIREEFYSAEAECILAIDIRGTEEQDELIWHFEEKNRFTVRSAYQVALRLRNEATCSLSRKS
ncbi:UNVERIFIED_CONTAM: hypothetical protein Sradi_2055100 [Sesamum radiatum]|uniref:Uncharacterized protein n=1 Tax=Sesamum radiatum TaxID=300843 RepID=A0AAW2TGX3_SESRA